MTEPRPIIVTGGVHYNKPEVVQAVLDAISPTKIYTGMAEGADLYARLWGQANAIPVVAEPLVPGEYPEPMHEYNEWMLSIAEPLYVVSFKDDLNPDWRNPEVINGTEHMMRIANEIEIPILHTGSEGSHWIKT